MYYPLSDKDVVKVAGDGTRVFMYARLPENIDNLVNDRNPNAIILYESQRDKNGDSYGHWCSVNKVGNDINFFDSYGGKIDSQLADIPLMFRKTSNQLRNKLSEMMANSNYNINYNEHKYQQDGDYQTCGRHCAFFCRLKLSIEEYNKFMKMIKNRNKYNNYDETIVKLTDGLF